MELHIPPVISQVSQGYRSPDEDAGCTSGDAHDLDKLLANCISISRRLANISHLFSRTYMLCGSRVAKL